MRLDAGFSMVCSELPEVVSTSGGGVFLVGRGVRTPASSCSMFCGSKKIEQGHQVVCKGERKRGGKDSAAGAHRVGRDSRKWRRRSSTPASDSSGLEALFERGGGGKERGE